MSEHRARWALAAVLFSTMACDALPSDAPQASQSPRPSAHPAGSDIDGTLQAGNIARSYTLHLPPDSSRLIPTPIVIAFHGYPMTASQMSRVTHLSAVADRHGFAVLFPQGYRESWAVPGGSTPAQQARIDDVGFVRSLLVSVSRAYSLDTSRVIATGISNGGIFTELLGCRLADRLIGIVPVAGLMRRDLAPSCRPAKRISVFGIHGTDDPVASYGGVPGADGFLSFADTLAFWAKVDGCSDTPLSRSVAGLGQDKTTITGLTYSSCTSTTEVSGYAVNGGGHSWPGGESIGSVDEFGVTSRQFDASELIWSFLDRHR